MKLFVFPAIAVFLQSVIEPHFPFQQLRRQSSSGLVDFRLQSASRMDVNKIPRNSHEIVFSGRKFGGGGVFHWLRAFSDFAADSLARRVFDAGAFQLTHFYKLFVTFCKRLFVNLRCVSSFIFCIPSDRSGRSHLDMQHIFSFSIFVLR